MSSMTVLKLFRNQLTRNCWRYRNTGQTLYKPRPSVLGIPVRSLTTNPNVDDKLSDKTTSSEKLEFQAETRMLLDIVGKSLYSEKEVFIRELISNASDALEKLRYVSLKAGESHDLGSLEINISTDKTNRKLTIQDTGIGMSREELISNLGTIAKSGSKAFLQQNEGNDTSNLSSIIGQFGVGFYSCFMVADRVEVFTKSMNPDTVGYIWKSDGTNVYEISESDNVERGTKIVMYLKPDCREYASEDTVRKVINKYSNFVNSPIKLNGSEINTIQPLWLLNPKSVSKEQHDEFYKFVANTYDRPRFVLHYSAEAPIQVRALLYFPELAPGQTEFYDSSTKGVSLYTRRILVKKEAEHVLPKWLRFVKGVIDSEDIPLNLSREMLQNSSLLRKLNQLLTSRVVKFLHEKSLKDLDEYMKFYQEYGMFIKEGVVTNEDPTEREEIACLLRYESSHTKPGETTSFEEYIKRRQDGQNDIYYLSAPNRALAESSPYIEALKKKNFEVIYCYEQHDEIILYQLKTFKTVKLTLVEKEINTANSQESQTVDYGIDGLSQLQLDSLLPWIESALGNKVKKVKATGQLESHPCVITVDDMTAARHFIKTQLKQMDEELLFSVLQPRLELNPKHAIIKKLHTLKDSNPELAKLIVEQLYSNSMVTAGLINDSRKLVSNMNRLLELVVEKY
ncbi:Heat shock protein Hsp90, N-terminal,Ribosomal protein S5 domain 2-type fold,Heat shock protein Hsp90 [Cinara cedri]|uniref:Heat shock protein 75 kDa, mitochondrial n=1 Tax=Cinara cedri TaxID=506608 RepID=A0A5E4MEN9_9HEMI|nr:Heat shock protein Hsp90, N-terminal,Ribosomal protein S5 domain 2-type fold,Heat shock protein Hsp90 [Cinara cedri]